MAKLGNELFDRATTLAFSRAKLTAELTSVFSEDKLSAELTSVFSRVNQMSREVNNELTAELQEEPTAELSSQRS